MVLYIGRGCRGEMSYPEQPRGAEERKREENHPCRRQLDFLCGNLRGEPVGDVEAHGGRVVVAVGLAERVLCAGSGGRGH